MGIEENLAMARWADDGGPSCSYDDWYEDMLYEAEQFLATPSVMDQLERSLADLAAGRTIPLEHLAYYP